MGVDVSHLVLEALGHANDQVVDEGADGAEGSDVLAVAMVQLDVDDVLLRVREGDSQMAKVLDQLAAGPLDCDGARLDVDLDCWRGVLSVLFLAFTPADLGAYVPSISQSHGFLGLGVGVAHTALGDGQLLLGVDVAHLGRSCRGVVWWMLVVGNALLSAKACTCRR